MKRIARVALGICSVLLAGCHRKVSGENGLEFSFQPWVPLLAILAGIAVTIVGISVFRRNKPIRGLLLIVGAPLAVVVFVPGLWLDRVIVNNDGFYSRHGFWFSPVAHEIKYDELSLVQVTVEERMGRRGKTYNYYFDCSFKSGKRERVPLGDLMREALPEIAEQFRRQGVPVQMPPNLPK